jgi:hypothetical protein
MSEDVSLFIGCLPGADQRQIVLFPGGRVLAEVCQSEIETPTGDVPDRGSGAAAALIRALNGNGWYIDQVDHAAAVWLKPSPRAHGPAIEIRGVSAGIDLAE